MKPQRRSDWRPSAGPLVIAAAIAVGAALGWWWTAPGDVAAAPSSATASAPAGAAPLPVRTLPGTAVREQAAPSQQQVVQPSPAPVRRIARTRDPGDDQTPDLSDYVNEGERPTTADVIGRLQQAGVHGGLAAFPPPGTRPPMVGIAVPEDFALPEGYVRHHQATDDGQRIEAILMFAPDRDFFDAAGQPIAIPPDRVVPPEMAPPGLPLRRIVIPRSDTMNPRG